MQAWLLQFTVSVAFPGQISPPLEGSGLEHVLERVWDPNPQEEEQVEKADQLLQPPPILK